MTRTKLCDRALPSYTRNEELLNTLSHLLGVGLGVMVLAECLSRAWAGGSTAALVCGAVFGISMILLYAVSGIYHGLRTHTAKKVFQVIDHCTIYLLIAGTYTPMLVCGLAKTAPVAAYILLAVVWGCAIPAVTLTAIDLHRFRVFSMVCYIGMGWVILFSIEKMYMALGSHGFWLLLGGGILYTVGAVLFRIGKRVPYFHTLFHVLVLAGSVLHAACVILYLM